jgi:hypothetical protein
MPIEQTILALRITAWISSFLFALAYALRVRRYWLGFVAFHMIHLSFILWWAFGLGQYRSGFNFWAGVAVYLLIVVLAAVDLVRPGVAMRNALALHIIWLNLLATFVLMIAKHWQEGLRYHSLSGALVLLTSAYLRFSREICQTVPRPLVQREPLPRLLDEP